MIVTGKRHMRKRIEDRLQLSGEDNNNQVEVVSTCSGNF